MTHKYRINKSKQGVIAERFIYMYLLSSTEYNSRSAFHGHMVIATLAG